MQVDIWSDVVCPWCYIGKRRFEAALAEYPGRDEVKVVYHSFELDPGAPRVRTEPTVEHLAAKYGISVSEARSLDENVTKLAAAEGLEYHLDSTRSGNTFDAHRLLHYAASNGKQLELKERLMRAYFTESLPVTETDTLARLASEVGLDAAEARTVLESDLFGAEVRGDEGLAQQLGIGGVPYYVFDFKYGVSGAQSREIFARVLQQVGEDASADASSGA